MSRKFILNVGPRDSKDEKRLLIAVIRQAKDGDDVTLNLHEQTGRAGVASLDTTAKRTQPNDQASQRVGEAVGRHLEEKASIVGNPVEKSPQEYAYDLLAAMRGLTIAGARFGRGIAIEVITTRAFELLLQNYATYIEAVRNMVP